MEARAGAGTGGGAEPGLMLALELRAGARRWTIGGFQTGAEAEPESDRAWGRVVLGLSLGLQEAVNVELCVELGRGQRGSRAQTGLGVEAEDTVRDRVAIATVSWVHLGAEAAGRAGAAARAQATYCLGLWRR